MNAPSYTYTIKPVRAYFNRYACRVEVHRHDADGTDHLDTHWLDCGSDGRVVRSRAVASAKNYIRKHKGR